mmetsp:Transcript_17097/g.43814  ORF Transcript_17097/g.43814 Transcript_17097/m.43814 type:complete len:91 (-) Transcript_17097:1139-1411(-)
MSRKYRSVSYPPPGAQVDSAAYIAAFKRDCVAHLGFENTEQGNFEMEAIMSPSSVKKANLRLSVFHFLPAGVAVGKNCSTIIVQGAAARP